MSCAEPQKAEPKKKDMGLTKEALDGVLLWLDPDQDRATLRYKRIMDRLIRFLAHENVSDPVQLASETIDRVARAIAGGKPIYVKPETYFFAVAKNVAREDHRHPERKQSPIDELPPNQVPIVDPWEALTPPKVWELEAYHGCLKQCLGTLAPLDRAMIIQYHNGQKEGELKKTRKELASRLGLSLKGLHKRALRLRESLEVCIADCVKLHQTE